MQAEMLKAMRLTREGRLAEATATIQRVLGIAPAPGGGHSDPVHGWAVIPNALEDAAESISAENPSFRASDAVEEPPAKIQPVTARRMSADASLFIPPDLVPFDGLPLMGIVANPAALRPSLRRIPADLVAPAAGQFIARTYTGTSGSRVYKLYVPGGYKGQALPLIVMLHGCTQVGDDFAAGTRMNFLAEANGLLIAYPEQPAAANTSRCWNWFRPADQQRDHGEPLLIAGITREVMAKYHVDASRICIAGLSAGGAMAAVMGAAYPDLYAAVGVHSGLAPGSAQDLPSALQAMKNGPRADRTSDRPRIPLILFQGDHDSTVHPRNADEFVRQWCGGLGELRVTVHQGQVAGGRTFIRAVYRDVNGEAIMERWTVLGGGHAWSGGSSNGSYTDPAGPDASRELVRFLREHPRAEDGVSPHRGGTTQVGSQSSFANN